MKFIHEFFFCMSQVNQMKVLPEKPVALVLLVFLKMPKFWIIDVWPRSAFNLQQAANTDRILLQLALWFSRMSALQDEIKFSNVIHDYSALSVSRKLDSELTSLNLSISSKFQSRLAFRIPEDRRTNVDSIAKKHCSPKCILVRRIRLDASCIPRVTTALLVHKPLRRTDVLPTVFPLFRSCLYCVYWLN